MPIIQAGSVIVVHSVDSLYKWILAIRDKHPTLPISEIIVHKDIKYDYDSVTIITSFALDVFDISNYSMFIIDMAHLYDRSVFNILNADKKTIMLAYHSGILAEKDIKIFNFIPKISCIVHRYKLKIGGKLIHKLTYYEQALEVCTSKSRVDALIKTLKTIDYTKYSKVLLYVGDENIKKSVIDTKVPKDLLEKVDICISAYSKQYDYSAIIIYNPYVSCNRSLINKLDCTKKNIIIEFYDEDRETRKHSTNRIPLYKELEFDGWNIFH
jgi:hypothetical protein